MAGNSSIKPAYLLPYAQIQWLADDTPYAHDFDDIYWSQRSAKATATDKPHRNGLTEKQHVFIEANGLESQFAQLNEHQHFTLLETGFGFGLNFFLTMQAWRAQNKPTGTILQYVAFEKFLVHPNDMAKRYQDTQDPLIDKLLSSYPLPIPGAHHIWLSHDICLTLVLGDIQETLPKMEMQADVCFLDGFSPAKNADMWDENLFEVLFQRIKPGATLSSYSVAGIVRRGLAKAGFSVTKIKGFSGKAEMLLANKESPANANSDLPMSDLPKKSQSNASRKIVLIGAGLAGIFCAAALERRKISFEWLEANDRPLGAVADINQLAISPRLAVSPQRQDLVSLLAFEYLRAHVPYHVSGQLRLAPTESDRIRAKKLIKLLPDSLVIYLDAESSSAMTCSKIDSDGLYYPTAGWVDPVTLIDTLNICPKYNQPVSELIQAKQGWLLRLQDQRVINADTVILATGAGEQELLKPLNLNRLGGQSIEVKLTPSNQSAIISGQVSVFPAHKQKHTIAGTYRYGNALNIAANHTTQQDTEELLDKLSQLSNWQAEPLRAAYGIRTASRDRMPVVGQVPNWPALKRHVETQKLRTAFADYLPGLFCLTGFGSHGATMAAYCAEHLVRRFNQEPHSPLTELSAARFALRDFALTLE